MIKLLKDDKWGVDGSEERGTHTDKEKENKLSFASLLHHANFINACCITLSEKIVITQSCLLEADLISPGLESMTPDPRSAYLSSGINPQLKNPTL